MEISNLYAEIFSIIFENLNISDILNLTRVNRLFYDYIHNHKWTIGFIEIKNNNNNIQIINILSKFRFKHICFSSIISFRIPLFLDFINNCKTVSFNDIQTYYLSEIDKENSLDFEKLAQVENLTFSYVDISGSWFRLFKNCRSIKFSNTHINMLHISAINTLKLDYLCFENCVFEENILEQLKIPSLKEFSINTDMESEAIIYLYQNSPNIVKLELLYMITVCETGFIPEFKNLKSLTIMYSDFGKFEVYYLNKCLKLEYLKIISNNIDLNGLNLPKLII